MPSQAKHKETADRFLRLYEAIPEEFPEGRAIALFYCALHLIEMVAATENRHCRNHFLRGRYIRSEHRHIWKFYRPLQEASEHARYLAGGGFTMTAEQVESVLRRKYLAAIEQWAMSRAGESDSSPSH